MFIVNSLNLLFFFSSHFKASKKTEKTNKTEKQNSYIVLSYNIYIQ